MCNYVIWLIFAVYPLLDVEVLAVPYSNASDTTLQPAHLTDGVIHLEEGDSFEWYCSVEASLGDELQWVFNGDMIPARNGSTSEVSEARFVCLTEKITRV